MQNLNNDNDIIESSTQATDIDVYHKVNFFLVMLEIILNFAINFFPSIGRWFKNKADELRQFFRDDYHTKLKKLGKFFINYALVLFIIIYVIIVAIINPNFVNFRSIVNLLTQASLLLMVSLGMAGIIVLSGADLSASSIMYFVVMIVTSLIANTTAQATGTGRGVYIISGLVLPLVIACVVAMIVGGAIGGVNGMLTAKFKVHPFIGTMATNFVFGASALTFMLLTAFGGLGTSVQVADESPIVSLVTGGIIIDGIVIPNVIWFAFVMIIVMALVWNKTKFGKSMFAVGGNQEAARVAGVNVKLVTIMVFVLAGVMYGYAAFFGVGINRGGSSSNYSLYGLYAIAACVIGGVSFTGGVGKIRGVVFGVLLFQLIKNSTSYAGLTSSAGDVFIGVVVALAVVFDMLKYLKKT